jgi:flagellar basal body-associated protein FliL
MEERNQIEIHNRQKKRFCMVVLLMILTIGISAVIIVMYAQSLKRNQTKNEL